MRASSSAYHALPAPDAARLPDRIAIVAEPTIASIGAGRSLAATCITLAPSTAMWDTSEYIAAAYTLGLPHPPGNPFFVLIGRVFAMLPIAPNVAMRINMLAALCSAGVGRRCGS